jgi:hypothetical protein
MKIYRAAYAALPAFLLLIGMTHSAEAGVVYTYTGNHYDEFETLPSCSQPTPCSQPSPYTSNENVVISFTVASPLSPSTEYIFADNDSELVPNLSLISWEATDGIFSFDSADTTWIPTFAGIFTTDANGNISTWTITASVNSSPADGMEASDQFTCSTPGCDSDLFSALTSSQFDFVLNSPQGVGYSAAGSDTLGTWSSNTVAPTPEPSAFSLSIGGAVLLLMIRTGMANQIIR